MLLTDRLDRAIAAASRHGNKLAVLFMDLDRFKPINDCLGHAVGDQVLQSVASRLVAGVRRSDTVSRQGGDEFVVLLSEVACAGDAAGTADALRARIAAPHRIEGRDHAWGAFAHGQVMRALVRSVRHRTDPSRSRS